jgi:hypothetical protein
MTMTAGQGFPPHVSPRLHGITEKQGVVMTAELCHNKACDRELEPGRNFCRSCSAAFQMGLSRQQHRSPDFDAIYDALLKTWELGYWAGHEFPGVEVYPGAHCVQQSLRFMEGPDRQPFDAIIRAVGVEVEYAIHLKQLREHIDQYDREFAQRARAT